ncbi:ABC transporter permease [Embleya sp. NBC_00896]|uniref:ABC transporter permease n=1 Tax=Embleya sp. NBC_00896 TaxID=2975961 RepID=UPI00386FF309|nr:ABC transporter permease [Embleya sp. NBC_00896]
MRHAAHAEWTKLRTVRSTGWLLLALIAATVVVGALTTSAVDTAHCPTPAECFEDTTKLSLTGVRVGQIAVVLLAVLAIGNEYGTGMVRTTLTAYPRRAEVLGAKAAVLVALVAVAGTVGVLGSLYAGRVILPGNGFTAANGYPELSLTDGPTLRAAVGTVLYLVLIALLAFGVGVAVRDTAGSVTTLLTLLYIVPVITPLVGDTDWSERLEKLAPMSAGLAIQATSRLDSLPIGPWAGLGVLACYAVVALLLGGARFVGRDV